MPKVDANFENILQLDEVMKISFELFSILKSNLKKKDMKRLSEIEKYTNELLKLKSMNKHVRN